MRQHLVRGGDREMHGREVLSTDELAVDMGWMLPDRANVTIDPALVGIVARLQRAVRR